METDEKTAKKTYENMAEAYNTIRQNKNFHNEFVEMPGMLKTMPELKDKKVLDIGCGTGIYFKEILNEKPLTLKGFDISPKMVEIAKNNNPEIEVRIGSAYKIPFNEKFDVAFASLVINYLKDWEKFFGEAARIITDNGELLVSIKNPILDSIKHEFDYMKTSEIIKCWDMPNGVYHTIKNYHRSLQEVFSEIKKSDFEIAELHECTPVEESKYYYEESYYKNKGLPLFIVLRLTKKKFLE